MKKKKILLAVLASLCVAASATAFAACQENNGEAKDEALYAAYQTYAEKVDNPLSYEDWVENILDMLKNGGVEGPKGDRGEDGLGIKDINIVEKEGKLYFRFTMTNDSVIDVLIDNSVE